MSEPVPPSAAGTPTPAPPLSIEQIAAAIDAEGGDPADAAPDDVANSDTDTGAGDTSESTPDAAKGEGEGGKDAAAGDAKDKPADGKAPSDEAELQKLAQKYANGTMAAARRAQAKAASLVGENERLTTSVKQLQTQIDDPRALVERHGGVKQFLQKLANAGEPDKAPTPEDRIAKLEREIKERDEKTAKEQQAREVEGAKTRTFEALAKDDRYDLVVNTSRGRDDLWDAITAYSQLHGAVPDEAVFQLADAVEAAHEKDLAKSKKLSGQRQPANKGDLPPANAAPAGKKSGKTITNNNPAAPLAKRPRPVDDDEDRLETLRAIGAI